MILGERYDDRYGLEPYDPYDPFGEEPEGRRVIHGVWVYGMRLRGFSIGCQPMDGLVQRIDDISGKYYDLLVYNRQLIASEKDDYDLDFIEFVDEWEVYV